LGINNCFDVVNSRNFPIIKVLTNDIVDIK